LHVLFRILCSTSPSFPKKNKQINKQIIYNCTYISIACFSRCCRFSYSMVIIVGRCLLVDELGGDVRCNVMYDVDVWLSC